MNIWFLRMDKDGWDELDLNQNYKYIHSAHGSCGGLDVALRYKKRCFPELTMNGKELAKFIRSIKQKLIANGLFDLEQSGKRRCDIALRYWLSEMQVDDLVFVRNKQGKVMLCKITGYISEDFFDKRGCFQRPVEILNEIKESVVPSEIWGRTQGRKTIERNAKKHITTWVTSNYELLICSE
ncbi:hypothetical protein HJP15_16765 [Pseudoalteromonas sp. NEC-BIFX-2020_002]|uniref:hypothetical protein n=1 Tax=Pseudoalteromonas sp. NEC-BIFX-2020_002 TaxID=2732353 RepID=UPI0014769180|nr:hypothetical protein [Pseudoalteromonas sp. NEC-BIFX-2020_002]NNG44551.1 hypothetical protein [Pseudoalteromonas sp. NEC-BIFX-2020_002]